MSKKIIIFSLFFLLFSCAFSVSAVSLPATLDIFTIDNIAITPQDVSGTIATSSTIDLRFSGPVSVSLDILDSSSSLVKHIYNSASVTNPDPKVWLGKDNVGAFVVDGIYTVQVVYTSSGVTATDTAKTITVSSPVVDTTAPVITLLGEAVVNLLVGDTYTDAGVTVIDDIDGDITASTTITGLPIDTSATGTQYVIYTATDSSSNLASSTRTINISEPAPVVIPVSEPAPSRSSGSSGYVQNISFLLANPNTGSTEGQVLGASTSRISEETRQRRLAHLRRRLLEIKRELLLLEHPELKEIILAEDPLAIIPTTTLEVVEATTTTGSSTDPVKKPFWKFW